MKIKLYDRVELKSGVKASIVDIYDGGVAFEADIDYPTGTETDTIQADEILRVILQ